MSLKKEGFLSYKVLKKLNLKSFFQNFHTQRIKKNIKVKMLANIEEKNKLVPATGKKSEIKYLPEYLITNTIIMFHKNKVLIYFLTNEPKGIVIEDEEVVKSFKTYFNTFWKIAEK
jgi:hypothetical protein